MKKVVFILMLVAAHVGYTQSDLQIQSSILSSKQAELKKRLSPKKAVSGDCLENCGSASDLSFSYETRVNDLYNDALHGYLLLVGLSNPLNKAESECNKTHCSFTLATPAPGLYVSVFVSTGAAKLILGGLRYKKKRQNGTYEKVGDFIDDEKGDVEAPYLSSREIYSSEKEYEEGRTGFVIRADYASFVLQLMDANGETTKVECQNYADVSPGQGFAIKEGPQSRVVTIYQSRPLCGVLP